MARSSWPSDKELHDIKEIVAGLSKQSPKNVKVVLSPYRICPLGAHIDHQGGTVSAMTINRGILLGFVPSDDAQVVLKSAQFDGDVRFSVDDELKPKDTENAKKRDWGDYARGAVYALKEKGFKITKGIMGFVLGCRGLDSSGLSSSAAVGLAYLLALENANGLSIPSLPNVELAHIIENGYLCLKTGILDQSAILLSRYGFLTRINCKDKSHEHILLGGQECKGQEAYKILLAFSGVNRNLRSSAYNTRVDECKNAAKILLGSSVNGTRDHLLSNVEPAVFEAQKANLERNLSKRAEHYFSESKRVAEGLDAWASGNLPKFGRLISESGRSSIENYECGCEEQKQLWEILQRAPGVYGARFSGAGFGGCCIAFVDTERAVEAASFVRDEYCKVQPDLASMLGSEGAVLICEAGDCACIL